MPNFNRYKVNCSDLPDLMSREQGATQPTEKELEEFLRILEKDMLDVTDAQVNKLQHYISKRVNYDNYSLSTTARKAIYKHYAYSKYKVSKVSMGNKSPMQLEKGEIAEPDAIKLLSKLDGVEYTKNEKLYSNKWFKGIPDIILQKNDKIIGVKDIKVAFDLPSFLERVDGDSVSADRWEMTGYLDIFDIKEGEICYCLVNMPDIMKETRLAEHRQRMTSLGYEPSHIKRLLRQIEKSMSYDYLPDELRIKRFPVQRKGYFTKQAHNRVKVVRDRLSKLDMKFLQKTIILSETEESLPPESTF